MNQSFGPWSTAIATGANPQLSTFWKRRLVMLSSLKESSSLLTRRAALILACLAAGALAIPTLKWAAEGGVPPRENSDADSLVVVLDDRAPAKMAGEEESKPDGSAMIDEYFPRPSAAEKKILDALEKPVNVEWSDMPLDQCIEALELQSQVDFWIDKARCIDEGVSLDQPVTLKIKGRRLESVLNLILHPLQLTWLYEDEVLKITTAQSAGERLFTRTYPVGDLCPEPKEDNEHELRQSAVRQQRPIQLALFQGFGGGGRAAQAEGNPPAPQGGGGMRQNPKVARFANLMHAISTACQPDSWEELSGPGSIVPVYESNSLVIRQTRPVHREVVHLLRDLRAAKRIQHETLDRSEPAQDPAGGPVRREGF